MSRQGRLAARRIAVLFLGAMCAAALVLDHAWSQTPARRGSLRTAQAPLSGPELAPAEQPPPVAIEPAPEDVEARFLTDEPPVAPGLGTNDLPELEELNDYTVPLRQSSDGILLEKFEDGSISLVARNASLKDVLIALAETQNLNLITQESVDAQINATLHDLPFEDVLDVILSTSGYTWVRNRNVIQVTSVSNTQKLAPQTQGRMVEVFQLDFVSATDVGAVVQTMLSQVGHASVVLSDPKNNRKTQELLIVQDLPNYLSNIRDYIRRHDVPPRQVLIEAYILKVDLSDDMRNGVNFDHVFSMHNNLFQIESRGLANSSTNQGFMVNLSGGNLAAVVEMLETTTDAKTLASPKIRVLNGQTAHIQVGEQLGFRITTTTQTSSLESVQFLEVGVVLEVTPRISSDGRVIMHVKPEVSSGLVNPATGLPEEKTTELQTDVMFHDNQAYVIGGLIQETDTDVKRKLPWLGNLKHVGHLFQRSEVVKHRSEVIVALLPRVMPFDPATNDGLLIEAERATTPLLYGPLLEYPRPWEAQVPHVVKNPTLLRLPSTKYGVPYKDGWNSPPPHALEPIKAVPDAGNTTDAAAAFNEPVEAAGHWLDANRTIGPHRITRLPPIDTTPAGGSGYTAPSSGTIWR